MKQSLIRLGLLGGVLVVLLAALLLVYRAPVEPGLYEGGDAADDEAEAVVVYALDSPVRSLTVTLRGEAPYTLANLAETLEDHEALPSRTLLELEDLPLYYAKIESVLESAASLEAIELVLETSADYAEFGLEDPASTVELLDYDGHGLTLLIGNQVPTGDGYFLRVEGEPAIYRVSNSIAASYLGAATTYMTTLLTPGSYAQFYQITLGGTVRGELGAVTVRSVGETSSESTGDYRVVEPVDRALGGEQGLQALASLFGFQALDILSVYPDEETLTGYGLDAPYYATARVVSEELGDFSLIASRATDSGLVFVMLEDVPVIYAAGAESMPWLEAQYYDLIERAALPYGIAEVDGVTVETASGTHSFAVSAGEALADLAVTADGAEIDSEFFYNYFQTLTAARLDEYTDDAPGADEQPVATVSFHLIDGGAISVRFYGADATRRSFILLDGERPYYTSAGYVNRVVEDLDRLLNGEVVQAWAG